MCAFRFIYLFTRTKSFVAKCPCVIECVCVCICVRWGSFFLVLLSLRDHAESAVEKSKE